MNTIDLGNSKPLIPGLTVVRKPLETYLILREADGDRELTASECEKLAALANAHPPADSNPDWDKQPGWQFILIEGWQEHSGVRWTRLGVGTAASRKPGTEGEMLGYRRSDIERICKDYDIAVESAELKAWQMLPRFPADSIEKAIGELPEDWHRVSLWRDDNKQYDVQIVQLTKLANANEPGHWPHSPIRPSRCNGADREMINTVLLFIIVYFAGFLSCLLSLAVYPAGLRALSRIPMKEEG